MNNIKNIRLSRGISCAELHRLTNIPLRTLEDWESDKRTPKDYHRLKTLASILDCSIDDLMIRKEDATWNNLDVIIELELIENGTSIKIYYNDLPYDNLRLNEVITNACGTSLVNHLKKNRDISDFMENQIELVNQ